MGKVRREGITEKAVWHIVKGVRQDETSGANETGNYAAVSKP